jgi:riboflavin synthase
MIGRPGASRSRLPASAVGRFAFPGMASASRPIGRSTSANESFVVDMFTGLVEGRGIVRSIRQDGPGVELVIQPPRQAVRNEADAVQIGESIAINGCCLTVVRADQDGWSFQAGSETLSRTNLGELRPGDRVNLERSLPVNARIGGHFVQGHIDGVGRVNAIERDDEWVNIWFQVPEHLTRQMVEKGSVAVDGVSLTLVCVEQRRFSVALIPHTLEITTLGERAVGDSVNIETDILGKYIEKMLHPEVDTAAGSAN